MARVNVGGFEFHEASREEMERASAQGRELIEKTLNSLREQDPDGYVFIMDMFADLEATNAGLLVAFKAWLFTTIAPDTLGLENLAWQKVEGSLTGLRMYIDATRKRYIRARTK